jgi:hypothetical protein
MSSVVAKKRQKAQFRADWLRRWEANVPNFPNFPGIRNSGKFTGDDG